MRLSGCRRGSVALVNGDVKAALPKLFFHVDYARGLVSEQMVAHPLHLATREFGFGDIDGSSGQVGTYDITFGVGGIVVDAHQALLVFHGADGRADDQRPMEFGFVGTRKIGKKISGPGTAIAAILRQGRIDQETGRLRNVDELPPGDPVFEVRIVFNALEKFLLRTLILTNQRITRTTKSIAPIHARNIQSGDFNCACWYRRRFCGRRIRKGITGAHY